ncbi:xylosyltransferase oxt-like, partial [Haliotis asinina]|uniref:xylosyltransferase oxt-like n=1 Tax=Haliotis asinina TaxID=109174 RepID=UPI003531D28C
QVQLMHTMALESARLVRHSYDPTLLIIMVLLSYDVSSDALCDECSVKHTELFDNLVVFDNHLWSRSAPHQQLCFRLCRSDTDCFSFQFNTNTNICRGHASIFTSPDLVNTSTETGNSLYLTCKDYLGCYRDYPTRVLPHRYFGSSMTPEVCITYCTTQGYRLAATQASSQCFCGNSIPIGESRYDESNCGRLCTGDATQTCGGTWFMSVYSTGNS